MRELAVEAQQTGLNTADYYSALPLTRPTWACWGGTSGSGPARQRWLSPPPCPGGMALQALWVFRFRTMEPKHAHPA